MSFGKLLRAKEITFDDYSNMTLYFVCQLAIANTGGDYWLYYHDGKSKYYKIRWNLEMI